jgi:acylphosphatase
MEPNSSESRLAVELSGRVQGVGFRWWACREARRLGVRGTVRNLPNGCVEIQAAGSAHDLATFLEALRHGPPAALVSGERQLPPAAILPRDFRVVR